METFDLAVLILRLAAGSILLAHGVKHALGREKTTRWFGSIGFRLPGLQWFFSTATEIGVGMLLIVGLLASLAAAGLIGIMTVAFVSVHRKAGFWVTARPDEGWEYVFTLTVVAFAIALLGPGEVSLDAAFEIGDLLDGWIGLAIGGAGIVVALGQVAAFYRPSEAVSS